MKRAAKMAHSVGVSATSVAPWIFMMWLVGHQPSWQMAVGLAAVGFAGFFAWAMMDQD
jgi:hypothetical protein